MIGQDSLALNLQVTQTLQVLREEQKNTHQVLNETQSTVDDKTKELAMLLKTKQQKFEKLPALNERIQHLKENFYVELRSTCSEMNTQLNPFEKAQNDVILSRYQAALSSLHTTLEQNVLGAEAEEQAYRDLMALEEKLKKALASLVTTQIGLMEQCGGKLQKTTQEISEFLECNFSGGPLLQEQLPLLMQDKIDQQEEAHRDANAGDLEYLMERLRQVKLKYVFGLQKLDDLVGQNIMLDSLSSNKFFASPVKHLTSGGKTTGIKNLASYVPVVKVEVPYLNNLQSENATLKNSIKEEESRGVVLVQRLEEASQRIQALESAEQALQLTNAELVQAREAQALDLAKTKAALEGKSAELVQFLERIQTLETEYTQLKEKHTKLETTCNVLTEQCAEKERLLKVKELKLSNLLTRMTTFDKERQETESDLKESIASESAEKSALAAEIAVLKHEKEELVTKLQDVEAALKLSREKKIPDVDGLKTLLLQYDVNRSFTDSPGKENTAGLNTRSLNIKGGN